MLKPGFILRSLADGYENRVTEPCTANEKFQKRESVVYIIRFKENMSSRAEQRVTGATLVCRCSHQIHLCAGLLSES